jgi:hypothetical protein
LRMCQINLLVKPKESKLCRLPEILPGKRRLHG